MIDKAKRLFLMAIGLITLACSQQEEKLQVPAAIVSPDTMLRVLTDIHLAEGARVGSRVVGSDSLNIKDYYFHIWNRYGISQKEFRESFRFYAKHPEEISGMYQKMLDSLSVIEANLENSQPQTEDEN